jgi:hypothetical protein
VKAELGVLGAFAFAFGATVVLLLCFTFVKYSSALNSPLYLFVFLGFLLIGLGLWLIALSVKSETKQLPS